MIKIGDLAKICNVSTQTLRYYDTEGVLKPDITDSANGYRLYSVDAVEKYKKKSVLQNTRVFISRNPGNPICFSG